MIDKSYVGMEAKACIICGKQGDETILIHKRLREVFPRETMVTGFRAPCDECEECLTRPFESGQPGNRIALVGVDMAKSVIENDVIMPDKAYRTGTILFLERAMWSNCFTAGMPIPKGPMCFIADAMVEVIEARVEQITRFHNARADFMKTLPEGADEEAESKKFAEDYQDPNDAKGKESDGEDPV